MRIEGPRKTNSSKPSDSKKKASGDGAAFRALVEGFGDTPPPSAAAPTTAASSLLGLQEIDPEQEKRQKAVKRGTSLLEVLDTIRTHLLTGTITEGELRHLHGILQRKDDLPDDPALNEIIQEIELRAAVELAKRGFFS